MNIDRGTPRINLSVQIVAGNETMPNLFDSAAKDTISEVCNCWYLITRFVRLATSSLSLSLSLPRLGAIDPRVGRILRL